MTDKEIEILNKLAEIHNDYLSLPAQHQSDIVEWVQGIHYLQRIIATNQVRRDHTDLFHIIKKQ